MRVLTAIIILLAPLWAAAQFPDSYDYQDQQFIEKYVEGLRQEWDIVIPPLERMPTAPSAYELAQGNWGADWLGSNKHHDEIIQRATRKVVVFVFDTAPKFQHSMLTNVTWPEQDKIYTGESGEEDPQGHGTHVAGIIAANGSGPTIGIARALVDRQLIRVVARKVLSDAGTGRYSWIETAIRETNDQVIDLQRDGWFVIYNLSLGGGTTKIPGLDREIIKAKNLGVFVCVAAGNSYGEGVEFPGNSSGSSAVASIDANGQRSNFSSYGPEVFMAKPGRNILSTYPGNNLVELSGTSMATPGMAGIVAISASIYPRFDNWDIQEMLINTATDIDPQGRDQFTGYGYNFVGKILNYREPPAPDPDPKPDEPEGRSLQTIRAVLPGPFEAVYQRGQGLFKDIRVTDIIIDVRTKEYSEEALAGLEAKAQDFFTNRAMTLTSKEDGLRAGYWAGRFFEIYLRKEHGISSSVVTLTVRDSNGNTGRPTVPGIFDYLRASRRTTFKY